MKTFKLVCTEKDDGMIEMRMQNEGFNGMEIIAILETKKADLIEQTTHPEKFRYEREAVLEDGSTVKKIKEGEEKPKESNMDANPSQCAKCAYHYSNSKCRLDTVGSQACEVCDMKNLLGDCPCTMGNYDGTCRYFEEEK